MITVGLYYSLLEKCTQLWSLNSIIRRRFKSYTYQHLRTLMYFFVHLWPGRDKFLSPQKRQVEWKIRRNQQHPVDVFHHAYLVTASSVFSRVKFSRNFGIGINSFLLLGVCLSFAFFVLHYTTKQQRVDNACKICVVRYVPNEVLRKSCKSEFQFLWPLTFYQMNFNASWSYQYSHSQVLYMCCMPFWNMCRPETCVRLALCAVLKNVPFWNMLQIGIVQISSYRSRMLNNLCTKARPATADLFAYLFFSNERRATSNAMS